MNARHNHRHPLAPPVFPFDWASDWGQGNQGLWVAFTYKNVRQCLRWIPPGAFDQGSPTTEAGRDVAETQHPVVLSQGFWLADTPCTQALWVAVSGDNPSRFRGGNQPVERVSWEQVVEFMQTLNAHQPGLALRLPTEAEWEYACRAKTTTAYALGDEINPQQAHYDQDSSTGTVSVKTFPCNPWGLYDMHGNVWEWCADWFGDYPLGLSTDPVGPENGNQRVVRGGGWFDDARRARSACRSRISPVYRDDGLGFRFARGPSPSE